MLLRYQVDDALVLTLRLPYRHLERSIDHTRTHALYA